MNDSTSVDKRIQSLNIGPEFDTFTRVIIHAGQVTAADGTTTDLDYIAGNTSGRTMEITDPLGSQAKANALLAKLQNSQWQYQPYTADAALLDPAAELGDGISLHDTYSAIYRRDLSYSSLMAANISAPADEEIDHEFPYIPREDRAYKRETAFTRTQLKINQNEIVAEATRATAAEGQLSSRVTINANAITSEVSRATAAEGTLRSSVNQNASSISAEVSRATNAEATKLNHTRSNSTFGWKLTADGFYLNSSGNKNVFTATKDGIVIQGNATVTGKIQATSGFIGSSAGNGFTITNSAIYNGKTSRTDSNNGIYIGRDGIALGASSAFVVTNAGAVTAKNLTISGGSINIGNNFRVDSSGNLTASSGSFSGTVRAGQILYGGSNGTMNADGLTDYSIDSNKYSSGSVGESAIGGGAITEPKLANYSVTGGKIGSNAVSYGKVSAGIQSTLDQVGELANQYVDLRSRVASISSGYFNSISTNSIAMGNYYFYVYNGYVMAGGIW